MTNIKSSDMEALHAKAIQNSFGVIRMQMELVQAKRHRLANTIVLAGGLGSSRYVYHKLQECANATWNGEVRVLQPNNPWSAICRGAALHGHEKNPILSRQCRASYGFKATVKFDPGKHHRSELYYDALQEKRARD